MIEYELAQTQALHDILNNDAEYFFRRIARWYSSTFHTPLHEVEQLPWFEILQHYYEFHYEKMNQTELYELLQEIIPSIADAKEKEMDDFMKEIVEKNRLAIEKKQKKSENLKEVSKTFDIPEEDL